MVVFRDTASSGHFGGRIKPFAGALLPPGTSQRTDPPVLSPCLTSQQPRTGVFGEKPWGPGSEYLSQCTRPWLRPVVPLAARDGKCTCELLSTFLYTSGFLSQVTSCVTNTVRLFCDVDVLGKHGLSLDWGLFHMSL